MTPIVEGRGMSADRTSNDADDADLPAAELDAVSTGAAADSADFDERLKGLPRLLRFAMLISHKARHIKQRPIAEINELCPNLPLNAAWTAAPDVETGLALAAELDRRAVTQNEPNLRSLADCVRLLRLPVPRDATYFEEYRRVGKALLQAFHLTSRHAEEQLRCDLERFTFGWAALPACTDLLQKHLSAAMNATTLGESMAVYRIVAVEAAARRRAEEEERRKEEEDEKAAEAFQQVSSPAMEEIPDHHLVVARLSSLAASSIVIASRDCLPNAPSSARGTNAPARPRPSRNLQDAVYRRELRKPPPPSRSVRKVVVRQDIALGMF
jgi:ATP-dependent Lon protease